MYLERTERARMDAALDRGRVANVSIVQSADAAPKPVRPKRLMTLIVSVLAGFAIAAVVCAWRELTAMGLAAAVRGGGAACGKRVMSQAQPAEAATSSLGHADRVAPRSGALERRATWPATSYCSANRVVGPLPGHALRLAYLPHGARWTIGERSSIHHGLKVFGGRGRVRIGD